MITRVQIKNYRSIESVDVHLEPLTVLVGRNGSGKSSFVDAIKLVRDAMRVGLENAIIERHGFGSICRYSPRRKRQIEISLSVEESNFSGGYDLILASEANGFKIVREKAYYLLRHGGVGRKVEDSFERRNGKWVAQPTGNAKTLHRASSLSQVSNATGLFLPLMAVSPGFGILGQLLSGDFYTIFPNDLRQPQNPMNDRILSGRGENFVSVLRHLISRPGIKEEILSALSRVSEGISDIRVSSAAGFLVAELQHQDLTTENSKGEAPWFNLSQESDGTLRMLGLLTALYQTPSTTERPLLAIEEPEIALYPFALTVLADELKACSQRRPVLVTTQSPDLIARVEAQSIRVVEKLDGVTRIGPIEASQRHIIDDELFNASDLLRIEGLRAEPSMEEREAVA